MRLEPTLADASPKAPAGTKFEPYLKHVRSSTWSCFQTEACEWPTSILSSELHKEMAKSTEIAGPGQYRHKQHLEEDIRATGPLREQSKKRKARRGEEDDEDRFVDSRASRKILKIGRDLQEEEQRDATRPETAQAAFAPESRALDEDAADEDAEPTEDAWEDETQEARDAASMDGNVCVYQEDVPWCL